MDFLLSLFLIGSALGFAYCIFVPLLRAFMRESRYNDTLPIQYDPLPEGAFAALLPDRSIPLNIGDIHDGRDSLDR